MTTTALARDGWRYHWRSNLSLFHRTVRANFAYRSSAIMGLITYGVAYAVTFMVWRHVYQANGAAIGVPKPEMYTYLALAFCLNFALSISPEHRIGQRIRMGLIATDLLKPADYQLMNAVQCLGDLLYQATISIVLFAVAGYFLGAAILPAGSAALVGFAVSVILAFVVQFAIGFIFVQGAFYTNSGYGIFAARTALHMAFSGLSAPLVLYPPLLQAVARWLPFQHSIATPISIYNGWVSGTGILIILLEQAAWAIGLLVAGRVIMVHALKQLEIQGG